MINISDIAKKKLIKFIKQEKLKLNNTFIRLSVKNGGCAGLTYDISFDHEKNDEDKIFKHNEIKIIINKKDIVYLNNIKIEYQEGIKGKGFYFKNPNAKKTCGCGSSFSPL